MVYADGDREESPVYKTFFEWTGIMIKEMKMNVTGSYLIDVCVRRDASNEQWLVQTSTKSLTSCAVKPVTTRFFWALSDKIEKNYPFSFKRLMQILCQLRIFKGYFWV